MKAESLQVRQLGGVSETLLGERDTDRALHGAMGGTPEAGRTSGDRKQIACMCVCVCVCVRG